MVEQQSSYRHWRLAKDAQQILWLTLDRQGVSVNSLNKEVFTELNDILALIEQERPVGLVILSGKSRGFIAGADISQFTEIQTTEQAFELIRQAQIVLDRLSQLPFPTAAMIRGFCLGGGLELALACRYRIAQNEPATQIGLPEVKLGLHPGFGGTVRLVKLIGAPAAMKIMLTGKPLTAAEAGRIGVVDCAVPERHLETAARAYILKPPCRHQPRGLAKWSNADWVRPWLGRYFQHKLAEKVNEAHYPAPFAIIRNWIRDGGKGEQAMINEARSIAELMVGATSRELVRAFFLQDQLKAFAKNARFKPEYIHLVGAGIMGGDIAAWCAHKGFTVTLQDQSPDKIAPAMGRAGKWLSAAAMDRLIPDSAGAGVGRADVIIEAVFEDLAVKQAVFKDLAAHAKPQALLATNTSSIPLQEIAHALTDPSRLLGLHFFNPVAKMLLVEIVRPDQPSEELIAQAAALVNQLGHYPLPVLSKPGFLVNRILMPYLLEAVILHEEGVPIAAIDQAAKEFGMPMGPIELADKVGLDICLQVAEQLAPHYGFSVPEKLKIMVAEKRLGIKTGKGFYHYREGRPVVHKAAAFPAPDLTDRLILRLVNEAVACWGEKIVANADLLDAGMIYGIGFAPFRGGPMQYIRQTGVETIQQKLLNFAQRYGERFTPNPYWEKLALN